MPDPSMVVRVLATNAELKKVMKESQGIIATTEAQVKKLASSLQGEQLTRKAATITQAIADIGGATKLTQAEAARLLPTLDKAVAKLEALGKGVPDSIRQTQQALRAVTDEAGRQAPIVGVLQGQWAKLTSAFAAGALVDRGVQAAVDGFRMLANFVKESIQEFLEADKVQRQLTAALTAQGLALPQVIRHYDELADKYARLTINSDEAIKSTETMLVQVGGVLPSEMDRALDAVTNLSAGLGIDLRSAATMVAKAFEDGFGALKKAGITIDETRAKSEGMVYVLDQIMARFGGQASAEMQSFAGQIKHVENAWKDMQEEVGKTFAENGGLISGIALARIGVKLLADEIARAMQQINFMAALALQLAPPGVAGAIEAFIKSQMGGGGAAPKSTFGGVSEEEFWIGMARDQDQIDAELAKNKEERKKAARKEEERYRTWELERITGISAAERQRQQDELKFLRDRNLLEASHWGQGIVSRSNLSSLLGPGINIGYTPPTSMPLRPVTFGVERDPIGNWFQSFFPGTPQTGPSFGANFGAALKGLATDAPMAILAALQGGGNVRRSLGAMFGGGLTSGLMGNADANGIFSGGMGKQWQTMFGGKAGGMMAGLSGGIASLGMSSLMTNGGGQGMLSNIGSYASAGMMFGPWGAAVGAGIGAIVGIIKRGANNTKKAREEFAKELGFEGQGGLYAKLRTMGPEGDRLVNTALNSIGKNDTAAQAKWMKDVRSFFDRLEQVPGKVNELSQALTRFGGAVPKALDPLLDSILADKNLAPDLRMQLEGMRKPSWQAAQDFASKFGISNGALGSGFNQARLADLAFDLKHALDLFDRFDGADREAILRDMADEFSDLSLQSIRNGVALPKAVEEFVRQVSKMGLLIDENGNQIDLSLLSFKDIEDEYQKQVVSLLEQIRNLLTPASDPLKPNPPGFTPRLPGTPPPPPLPPVRDPYDPSDPFGPGLGPYPAMFGTYARTGYARGGESDGAFASGPNVVIPNITLEVDGEVLARFSARDLPERYRYLDAS